ncbi:MAG TPA: M20/M25/M40 family metallo-hydrolase [Candidatus Moranbacteria bacterium]|nr:M20/M25/M40 family metallo-hydrolase [Candidatus Moranbacteria bacterium]
MLFIQNISNLTLLALFCQNKKASVELLKTKLVLEYPTINISSFKKMTKIEELLVKMIKIPSVSGNEGAIGQFLFNLLKQNGFSVKKQLVTAKRFNVIAKKGNPSIYIIAHMDVVPGDAPLKVTKDKIYGRGAIDNKGNIAGAIIAAQALSDIGLIFTVGEEVDFSGAKKAPKPKNAKFIVMEPTKLQVATSQRGVISFDITAKGKPLHSSLPFKKQQSAIYLLTNFLQSLYKKNWTAFNAIITEGGEADNIVPAKACAQILTRPKNKKEYNEISSFIKKHKVKNISLKKINSIEPCKSNLLKNNLAVPYFSEMAFFKNSILFGVGDIKYAHKPNEQVKRKDLNLLPKKLIELVTDLNK